MRHVHSFLAAVVLAATGTGALAQQPAASDHSAHHGSAAPATRAPTEATGEMAEGEVRRVDKSANKVTLRHGPIKSLDMPAMTMVFLAADPKLLDGVKPGDKVRFAARQDGGSYIVTDLQPAQ